MYIYISKKSLRQSRHGGTEKKKNLQQINPASTGSEASFFFVLSPLLWISSRRKRSTWRRRTRDRPLPLSWVRSGFSEVGFCGVRGSKKCNQRQEEREEREEDEKGRCRRYTFIYSLLVTYNTHTHTHTNIHIVPRRVFFAVVFVHGRTRVQR